MRPTDTMPEPIDHNTAPDVQALEVRIASLQRQVAEYQRAEQDLARLFELSADLICVADTDGQIRYVNPACTMILGYSPEEYRAHSFFDLVHAGDRARAAAELGQVFSTRQAALDVE